MTTKEKGRRRTNSVGLFQMLGIVVQLCMNTFISAAWLSDPPRGKLNDPRATASSRNNISDAKGSNISLLGGIEHRNCKRNT